MIRRAMIGIGIGLTAIVLAGCAFNSRPLFDYAKDGERVEVKRIAKHQRIDYFHRWRRTAYVKNGGELHWLLSPDQKAIIAEYGQPDYLRRTFRSTRGDLVKEWAYLEKGKIFQFVRGKMVYEGDLTDLEKTLILRGYPNHVFYLQLDPNITRMTFVYKGIFGLRRQTFSFANGRLCYSQEIL
jgi:hypothetical protein